MSNGDPVAETYRINVQTAPSILTSLASMKRRRFGHCSIDVRGTLFVIGGFCHMDSKNSSP